MSVRVGVVRLGLVGYLKGVDIQTSYVDKVKSGLVSWNGGALLLVEHPPVYTIGIRTRDYSIEDEEKLKQLGADFVKTNRGGLITFHGPGQLVVYPIIHLKKFSLSMRCYVSKLEQVAIDVCSTYSLRASRSEHTGVWLGENKVCAIGVHASRHVTSHGLALNCSTDLDWFRHIVPCGISGKGVTSLERELGRRVTPSEVIPTFLQCFQSVFDCQLIEDHSPIKKE